MTGYEHNKRWRKKYPELWKKSKAKYYRKSRKLASNAHQEWTQADINMITDRPYIDSQIAQKIGRSIKAIHVKRSRLSK